MTGTPAFPVLNRGARAAVHSYADTAIRLARRFKMSPQFWMRLQADWDLAQTLARNARDAA